MIERKRMPVQWVLILVYSALFPALANAHSGMFPDNYRFDNSSEGRSVPLQQHLARIPRQTGFAAEICRDGLAGEFPCRNINLLSHMAPSAMGGSGSNLNDIWGWNDIATGKEYAIVGRTTGTSFVDVSDSNSPVLIGFLPSHNNGSDAWRDIKVYQDHAYIVADGDGNQSHGLQVYNLANLASVSPGSVLSETAHSGGFGNAHNIAINEDTGYAYVVGANVCSGGLYMVDISVPAAPFFAGCYTGDGYTHDVQCAVYRGPDTRYTGKEICLAFNEDTLTVIDVSSKSNPVQLSRTPYPNSGYTHQGWFLDDNQTYVILNDETDELFGNVNTTTRIFDLSLLTAPALIGSYVATTEAIDHNLYTKDGYIYESNYRAGLRVLASDGIASGVLEERAYFDTIPCSDSAQFSGTWSNYVYLDSGNVLVSDIETGLFVLAPDYAAIAANANDQPPATSAACGAGSSSSGSTSSSSGGGGGSSATQVGALLVLLVFVLAALRFQCFTRRGLGVA